MILMSGILDSMEPLSVKEHLENVSHEEHVHISTNFLSNKSTNGTSRQQKLLLL